MNVEATSAPAVRPPAELVEPTIAGNSPFTAYFASETRLSAAARRRPLDTVALGVLPPNGIECASGIGFLSRPAGHGLIVDAPSLGMP